MCHVTVSRCNVIDVCPLHGLMPMEIIVESRRKKTEEINKKGRKQQIEGYRSNINVPFNFFILLVATFVFAIDFVSLQSSVCVLN